MSAVTMPSLTLLQMIFVIAVWIAEWAVLIWSLVSGKAVDQKLGV